jgi:hypothetical protein
MRIQMSVYIIVIYVRMCNCTIHLIRIRNNWICMLYDMLRIYIEYLVLVAFNNNNNNNIYYNTLLIGLSWTLGVKFKIKVEYYHIIYI